MIGILDCGWIQLLRNWCLPFDLVVMLYTMKAQRIITFVVVVVICTVWETVLATLSFTQHPSSAIIAEGSNITLHCSVNAPSNEPVTYLWKYQGKFIDTDSSYHYQIASNGSLFIINVTKSIGNGKYECVASATDGIIISNPAKIQIASFNVPDSIYRWKNETLAEGTSLFLRSPQISSSPRAQFFWKRVKNGNREKVKNFQRFYISEVTGSLLISPVRRDEDNALFQLYVWNPVYHPRETHLVMEVHVNINETLTPNSCPQPQIEFYSTQSVVNALEGQTKIGLECLAVAKRCWSSVAVTWELNGNQYASDVRFLTWTTITKSHENTYKCKAKVRNRQNELSFLLNVKGKPKFTQPPRPSYTVLLGSEITIGAGQVVNAEQLRWYTKGERIYPYPSVYYDVDLTTSALKIREFSKAMSGLYQIFFTNDAGIVSYTIMVEIKTGCGSNLIGSRGNITFLNQTLPGSASFVTCTWLLQVPFLQTTSLMIDKFKFPVEDDCTFTRLFIYEGSLARLRNPGNNIDFCHFSGHKPNRNPIKFRSWFITVQLRVKRPYLRNGGFSLSFAPYAPTTNSLPSTTVKTATKAKSTTVSIKTSSSHKSVSSVTLTTLAKTLASSTTSATKVKPLGTKPDKDNSGIIFGAVGGAVGVLSVLGIVVAVFCCRKKHQAMSTNKAPLPHKAENGHNGLYRVQSTGKRHSPSASPFLNFEGPVHVDTQFVVQTKKKPIPHPNLILNENYPNGSERFELGYVNAGSSPDSIYESTYDSIGNEIQSGKAPTRDGSGHYYSCVENDIGGLTEQDDRPANHYYSPAENDVGTTNGHSNPPVGHYYSCTEDDIPRNPGPRTFSNLSYSFIQPKPNPTPSQQSRPGEQFAPSRPGSVPDPNRTVFPIPKQRLHSPLAGTSSDGYLVPVNKEDPSETRLRNIPAGSSDQPTQEPLYHVVEEHENQHDYQPAEAGEPSRYSQRHKNSTAAQNEHDGPMYYEPLDAMPKPRAAKPPPLVMDSRYVTVNDKASSENPLYEPLSPTRKPSDKFEYETLGRQQGSLSAGNSEGIREKRGSEKENEAYEPIGEKRPSQKESEDYQSLTLPRQPVGCDYAEI